MSSRTWTTWVTSAVVSGTLILGVVALTSQDSDATPAGADTTVTTATATATATVSTEPTAVATPSTDALDALDTQARVSVAVLDLDTGQSLEWGDDGTFDTASIVKADILAALLWQHEQDGTDLSATEQAQAEVMIEQSDNVSATSLFEAVGGETGLEEFNTMIGLTDTDVGSDGLWGLTQTTPADQIRLLQVLLGDDDTLSAESKEYAQSLMSDVVDAQNFGVSAAADDADDSALKVGYLQRSATGLWDVTSIGRIEAGGHTYLVAVLSDGNASFDAGISLVDEVARTAVASMG